MKTLVLGGGFTGLAAGITSGGTVYEALHVPGGLGASYQKQGYSFEVGGGHWLFGGDPSIVGFIEVLTPTKKYRRKSSVYFPDTGERFPYPLQSNPQFAALVKRSGSPAVTMKDWFHKHFGPELCERFFDPFHELYTAGLYSQIAPQDNYKTPSNTRGYNETFLYPIEGLGMLARKMAARCSMRFGKRVGAIDVTDKFVVFSDGGIEHYDKLISTLPLDRMLQLTGLQVDDEPDPHTSVLVLNIGAVKGEQCPNDHWLYLPHSKNNFHRVGFYSNVDERFLPRDSQGKVSLYVEKAYRHRPSAEEVEQYSQAVVSELQGWGFIGEVEVVDPTWIDCAYTWRLPDSDWRDQAIGVLAKYDITQCGRYGKWRFDGIAGSIKDGFAAGL